LMDCWIDEGLSRMLVAGRWINSNRTLCSLPSALRPPLYALRPPPFSLKSPHATTWRSPRLWNGRAVFRRCS
jgi:hypothetical protein